MPIAFENIRNTIDPHFVSVRSALERIKQGKSKDLIKNIRSIEDKKERAKLKGSLPSVLFSADEVSAIERKKKDGSVYVTKRADESVSSHSGYSIFDVDGLDSPEEFRDKLKENKFIYSAWVSPSGDGVNFLVKMTRSIKHHSELYTSFIEKFKDLNLDTTSRNISRVKYESYDPDLWVNENALEWDELPVEIEIPIPNTINSSHNSVKDWKKVNSALSKISESHDGEKMKVLLKISHLLGGWCANGDLDRDTGIKLLQSEIRKKNIDDSDVADKAIDDAFSHGEMQPLSMYEERTVLSMKVGNDKRFVSYDDVKEQIEYIYENGFPKGEFAGWKCSEDNMSFLLGSTTYLYSAPHMGKSQVAHEVFVYLAETKGWKVAMMSPETGTAAEIFGELMSIYVGKSFVGDFKMSNEEAKRASEFISEHFFIIEANGEAFTIDDFYSQVKAIEREFDIHIHLTSIDPLNYLTFDTSKTNGREDIAIGRALDIMLYNARKEERHNVLITHVRDQQIKTNENGQMYFPLASARDVANGQIFFRKGMQMISVYRPIDTENEPLIDKEGVPYKKNETHVWIQKAKPKGVAKLGMFKLFYDFKKNKYYEEFEGNKYYRGEYENEMNSSSDALQPNNDFIQATIDDDPPF